MTDEMTDSDRDYVTKWVRDHADATKLTDIHIREILIGLLDGTAAIRPFLLLYHHEYGDSLWSYTELEDLEEHARTIVKAADFDAAIDELMYIDLSDTSVTRMNLNELMAEEA